VAMSQREREEMDARFEKLRATHPHLAAEVDAKVKANREAFKKTLDEALAPIKERERQALAAATAKSQELSGPTEAQKAKSESLKRVLLISFYVVMIIVLIVLWQFFPTLATILFLGWVIYIAVAAGISRGAAQVQRKNAAYLEALRMFQEMKTTGLLDALGPRQGAAMMLERPWEGGDVNTILRSMVEEYVKSGATPI
jgi:Flp pilus assembly protein TadB